MEICTLIVGISISFMIVCLSIILTSDSDILTSLCKTFGKDPKNEFEGKVVWIIGASSGIGEGIAKALAKSNGCKLIISARRTDQLERVKRECLEINPSKSNNTILTLPFDILEYSSHEPELEKVLKTFGKLDVLVSNAGRSQHAAWHEIEIDVDRELFEINVFSLINLNRIVLRYFMRVGSGHLAVTSSLAVKISAPDYGSYPGSKSALHGYFGSLRNEVSRDIAVTLICPGPVFSEIRKESFTSHKGIKTNRDYPRTEKRMSAERCGYLSSVALASKLEESWIAPKSIILLTYFSVYQPYIFAKLMNFLSVTGFLQKIRKSRKDQFENNT